MFRPDPAQPEFDSLKATLLDAKLQTSNNALYQTIFNLIEKVRQARDVTLGTIENIIVSITNIGDTIIIIGNLIRLAPFLTWDADVLNLPNSRQLLAGTGITFDDTVANERTISSTGGGAWKPVTTGAEPIQLVSDGIGQCVMVPFDP